MRHLTIDLEDWFQVYNLRDKITDWHLQESRIIYNTKRLLSVLRKRRSKATFFVLGWLADRFPELIKDIHDLGHEISCHGYYHKPLFLMDKQEFSKDLDKAIKAIRHSTGIMPKGYRAPSFSMIKQTLWALDILHEKGFRYDSSMVPVNHPDYGIKGIPNKPFRIKGMMEYPITTKFGFPVGGGYFRVYPYFFSKFLIRNNKNAVFYLHPWELDPEQPKVRLPLLKRFRHYYGLKKTEDKFERLLKDFSFQPIII